MTRALAATLFAALVLIPAAGTHGIKEGGTFRVGIPAGLFGSIDPVLANGSRANRAPSRDVRRTNELPRQAAAGGAPHRARDRRRLPEGHNGGKKYTFTIRKGFRFSTGSAVTARSFAHTINRLLDPKMKSGLGTDFDDIVGAQKVHRREGRDGLRSHRPRGHADYPAEEADGASRLAGGTLRRTGRTPIDPEGVKAPLRAPAPITSPSSSPASGSCWNGTVSTAAPPAPRRPVRRRPQLDEAAFSTASSETSSTTAGYPS